MSGRRAFIHSFSLLVIRGSLPTTHSLITVNHLFPGFLLFIQGVLLTTLLLVSVNHSFSCVTADHSFAGFLPVIDCLPPTIFFSQAFLLVICGPQLTTLSMI